MASIAKKAPTKIALPDNKFTEIASLNLDSMLETKGQFKYVSWPHAIKILKSYYPDSRIAVTKFPDDRGNLILPYLKTPQGFFVEVTLYKDKEDSLGQALMQPILDFQNKSIAAPNSFQINTSIMRTKAKVVAIAIGAGLYVYAGEDLPTESTTVMSEEEKLALVAAKAEVKKREILQVILKTGQPLGWNAEKLKELVKEKFGVDSGLALDEGQLKTILELVGKEAPNEDHNSSGGKTGQ